jgi:hypothetical protein
MKRTVAQHVLRRIRAKGRGWVFTPKDMVDIGTRPAVDQALHRLAEEGIIQRLDRGIYFFASEDAGPAETAHVDAIARAIAAQTGDRAMLPGAEAARRLGLVVMEAETSSYDYLTTGRSKERHVGGRILRFRRTATNPPVSVSDGAVNVMHALLFLGREAITEEVMDKCARALHPAEREQLRKLAAQAPAWLIPVLHLLSARQDTGGDDGLDTTKARRSEEFA